MLSLVAAPSVAQKSSRGTPHAPTQPSILRTKRVIVRPVRRPERNKKWINYYPRTLSQVMTELTHREISDSGSQVRGLNGMFLLSSLQCSYEELLLNTSAALIASKSSVHIRQ
jgi:hypothetical protein